MSGLGFLQATLSLCYFNQMPKSFVKQIFNVEFLDKLDIELASCYYKVSTLPVILNFRLVHKILFDILWF